MDSHPPQPPHARAVRYTPDHDGTGEAMKVARAEAPKPRSEKRNAGLIGVMFAALLGAQAASFAALNSRMDDLQQQIGDNRAEMHREIGELRSEMHREFGKLRSEMHREIRALAERMTRVEQEVQSLKQEVQALTERVTRLESAILGPLPAPENGEAEAPGPPEEGREVASARRPGYTAPALGAWTRGGAVVSSSGS